MAELVPSENGIGMGDVLRMLSKGIKYLPQIGGGLLNLRLERCSSSTWHKFFEIPFATL